jgi:hypothetical protein
MIAIARPTLSRALYTQMIGRGLRICDGKSDCLILDFAGNSGKYSLMSPIDILGGDYSEAEQKKAKKLAKKKPNADQLELLKEAREKLLEAAKHKAAKVTAVVRDFDPFSILDLPVPPPYRHQPKYGSRPMTDRQRNALLMFGVPEKSLSDLDNKDASKLLNTMFERKQRGLATYKQLKLIKRKLGVDVPRASKDEATHILDILAQAGWRPKAIPVEQMSDINWIATRRRQQ